MHSPFKRYKNADLYFPKTSDFEYSELLTDDYGNPVNISDRPSEEIHIEAYLKPIPSWKASEGKLFHGSDKGSGERVRGGGIENYITFFGYIISPLDIPSELGSSIINGRAEITFRAGEVKKGSFKLLEVPQPPALISYEIAKIITRINGVFLWQ